jgi:ABC-type phosphate/phosphonate transport system permease subunit
VSNKELGEALLKSDASGTSAALDPRQLAEQVLRRDRRRVRLLTGLTLLLWLLAAAGIGLVLYGFYWHWVPKQMQLMKHTAEGVVDPDTRVRVEQFHLDVVAKAVAVMAISVAILGVATLCTVLLIFASRRATLRQVNASLLEISEQLSQLRQGPGK